MDVLVLNTAVVDFRHPDFEFASKLVGDGGLTICTNKDQPDFSQDQHAQWTSEGLATAGGCGNNTPLMARAGLRAALGANLGAGDFDGLDAQGRFFFDRMTANGVDMSATFKHQTQSTGTTYIHHRPGDERGGIAYFPGANDDFDFDYWRSVIERMNPKIVYYMYVGLSRRGDANGGNNLADFFRWCRERNIVTVVDTSTLTSDPAQCIQSGKSVPGYRLLEPVLPNIDVFFTSSDEAKIIQNTLTGPQSWDTFDQDQANAHSLDFLADRFLANDGRTRMLGITFAKGAYEKHILPNGQITSAQRIESRFIAGEVVDLVGAGDAFRAGLITSIAKNLPQFIEGTFDFAQAVQMGNLFAALYIKAPLDNRYAVIKSYNRMLRVVQSSQTYRTFDEIKKALD